MKFKKEDTNYLTERKRLSEKYGQRELWSVMDHWPLYCGTGNMNRFLSIYEIVKSVKDVPGHFAEFGCWRGANLVFLAKLLKIIEPQGNKIVHGFESFDGLSEFNEKDFEAIKQQGKYKGSEQELRDFISLYNLQDDIVIHKGKIEETLPEFTKTDQAASFSLVYCDTDLYESSKLITEQLHQRLSKGGLFVFDEWNYSNWPGESIAVREFLSIYGDSYDMINNTNARQPSLIMKKTRC
jgi:SAM-dependent methyltransferase